jgi:epoxyqueuosine reductase QueG
MKTRLDRRGFLKITAQGVAAAGLADAAYNWILPEVTAAQESQGEDSTAWMARLIRDYTANSPSNSLHNESKEKAWDEPLVGFARGDDSIFQQYKDYVGPFHWTPLEIFQLTFPDISVKPAELAVISWILPHTEAIKSDLRKQTRDPSEKWIRARIYGEAFNEELRRYVAETLVKAGHPAVVPILSSKFKTENSERYGMASSWSERHAAYAAGLGTFGLCDGLITPKGKAIRCGSVVARLEVPAAKRPYQDHHAYCLFYAKGICGMCTTRCPAGAVTRSGHNKMACMKQCNATAQYAEKELGLKGYGCGFCQTGVPCESRIPV